MLQLGAARISRTLRFFIGEIPQALNQKNVLERFLGLKRTSLEDEGKDYHKAIVVKDKSRDVINEAFRVVRANLEFMLGKDTDNKIIMSTSMNQGSGKTFLTMNMAVSLGIKGKRVIIVDLDLRKASISRYVDSPHHGVSDYLGGVVDEYNSLIVKGKAHEMVDMLPVGVLPPNPAELLYSDRLQTMLNELRQAYDYVFKTVLRLRLSRMPLS
jgi:Mrp family chromosome partitioning ATPase